MQPGVVAGQYTFTASATDAPGMTDVAYAFHYGDGTTEFATQNTVRHSFTDVLPSTSFKFDLTHNLISRFAVARTLSRPDYAALAPTAGLDDLALAGTAGNPDLRPVPKNVGVHTLAGTRAAVRTVIRYRNGVLSGRGASLLDGYMEDLATDRIYRLMIAQRMRHNEQVPITDESGKIVVHTPELLSQLFDEELERLLEHPGKDPGSKATFREARRVSEAMVRNGEFDPM